MLRCYVRDVDDRTVNRLRLELGIHPVTARCLAGRGITGAEQARSYLTPRLAELRGPSGLAGLEGATRRLETALCSGERIGCFGDYDVDGVTTTALLVTALRQLGATCIARVARRSAGYGFGEPDAEHFAQRGCSLVITGDCGTSDTAAIAAANARGLDVIVVDHHTVPARESSASHPAVALVNPLRADSTFPFSGMASVGLAFYLMAALRSRLRAGRFFAPSRPEPDFRDLLDFVALGTVADLVPLRGENRILAALGMRRLSLRRRPGVDALLTRCGVKPGQAIDERIIAWKLAPRLNAPGRLGDAEPALALLLANDRPSALAGAEQLEVANQERRRAQDALLRDAVAELGDGDPGPAIVLAGRDWPSGLVGIVAAQLVEHYGRPAFVIAVEPGSGQGRGSARSTPGVDLYGLLHQCRDLLIRYGGHQAAAGFTVAADQIAPLRERLAAVVGAQGMGREPPGFAVDAEVELEQVDHDLARELGTLAPFGKGNEAPLLVSRSLHVHQSRCVGDGSHLKLTLGDGRGVQRSAIGFGLGHQDPGAGAVVDAAFAPVLSTWGGECRVELEVRHLATRELGLGRGDRVAGAQASRQPPTPRLALAGDSR